MQNTELVQRIDDKQRAMYTEAFESLDPYYLIRKPQSFEDEVLCIIEGRRDGTTCPMVPGLGLRPGEVTIWGGINGHGKSNFTGQVALMLAERGIKPCIISLEMPAARTLVRMIGQWSGHYPNRPEHVPAAQKFLKQFQERILFFDYTGAVDLQVLYGAITIAAQQRGCRHIFVDNLMSCVSGEDDLNAQKNLMQTFCQLAKQLNIHIHVVHHVRKSKDETEEINKFSFRGAGAITDAADNVCTIQRNKLKEKKREEGNLTPIEDYEESDVIINVCKQRNGRWEGRRWLWFEPESGAYCIDGDRKTPWEVKA